MRAVIIALMFAALSLQPARAERSFALQGTAGVSLRQWWPGTSEDVIRLETEGLQAFRLDGRLTWRERLLPKLQHARTLDGSPSQQEMLAAGGEQGSALTATLGYLDLLAAAAASRP